MLRIKRDGRKPSSAARINERFENRRAKRSGRNPATGAQFDFVKYGFESCMKVQDFLLSVFLYIYNVLGANMYELCTAYV